MKIEVRVDVMEALERLLGPYNYPGLKLSGDPEVSAQFHRDVMKVAEFLAEVITASAAHG